MPTQGGSRMSRTSRIGSFAAVVAMVGAVLLPVSGATGAPTAHKSGAIVNYVSTAKIKIAKTIAVPFVCSVNCDVVSTLKVKGPFVKGADKRRGSLQAGAAPAHFLKPRRALLQLVKAYPRRHTPVRPLTAP